MLVVSFLISDGHDLGNVALSSGIRVSVVQHSDIILIGGLLILLVVLMVRFDHVAGRGLRVETLNSPLQSFKVGHIFSRGKGTIHFLDLFLLLDLGRFGDLLLGGLTLIVLLHV